MHAVKGYARPWCSWCSAGMPHPSTPTTWPTRPLGRPCVRCARRRCRGLGVPLRGQPGRDHAWRPSRVPIRQCRPHRPGLVVSSARDHGNGRGPGDADAPQGAGRSPRELRIRDHARQPLLPVAIHFEGLRLSRSSDVPFPTQPRPRCGKSRRACPRRRSRHPRG